MASGHPGEFSGGPEDQASRNTQIRNMRMPIGNPGDEQNASYEQAPNPHAQVATGPTPKSRPRFIICHHFKRGAAARQKIAALRAYHNIRRGTAHSDWSTFDV